MRCDSCERDNPSDARFCAGCGRSLGSACGECGRENQTDARFCNGCGSSLGGAPDASPRAPRDYTPPHLAKRILSQRAALEGERKQVTVLFADLKGSLELAGRVDPEIWHEVLDRFFEILTDGIHRFDGTINQYTGDGIMALFGAPIAHEDHAQRACWAALHLKTALREYSREMKREHGLGVSTRMGIHSGEVVVGKIGDDLRMDYTAQGHTVGLAARMEGLAEPNAVYLTGDTASLVEGYLEIESLGDFSVKGVTGPVAVYELIGAGKMRTRFDLSRSRGLSRFVGREADLAALESALEAARGGAGQIVGVVGEAGVGKSRLCHEFVESCLLRGVRVYRGSAVSHGSRLPGHAMMQVFRDYFGLREDDDPRAVREKLAGRILLLDPELQEAMPLIFDFFGVADPTKPSPPMDPDVRQRRVSEALRRLIQSEETTITLIEDVHWFDPTSEELLAQWVDAMPGARTVLLLNFRPEYRPAWVGPSCYRQLAIKPLGPVAMKALLKHLLGDDERHGDLAALIAEQTAGSPFFAEEVVRDLVESGALEGERGACRPRSEIRSIKIPATVESLLAARIDRLDERAKNLLQAAAVIGREFGDELLASVLGEPVTALRAGLATLIAAELVHEEELFPRVKYAFRHPLTQEVAYASQLRERRAVFHAAVADHLEVKDDAEGAALVGQHREAAGDTVAAAENYCLAADRALLANRLEAARLYRRVLDLCVSTEVSGPSRELRKRSILGIFNAAGYREGMDAEEIDSLYADGRRLGEEDHDDHYLASLMLVYLPTVGIVRARIDEYVEMGLEAHKLAMVSGDGELIVAAMTIRAYGALIDGRLADAYAVADELVRWAGDDHRVGLKFSRVSGAVFGRMMCGNNAAVMGRLDEGRRCLREAESIALEVGSNDDLCWVLNSWALVESASGSLEDGEARARQSLEVAERGGGAYTLCGSLDALAASLMVRKRWREALAVVDRCDDLSATSGTNTEDVGSRQIYRAQCLFEMGDVEGARRLVETALHLIEAGAASRLMKPGGRVLAGMIHGMRADFDEGNEMILIAIDGAAFVDRIEGLRARARLAHHCGRLEIARDSWQEVKRLADQAGATGHVAAAEQALAELAAAPE